jgi:hypothetical protein
MAYSLLRNTCLSARASSLASNRQGKEKAGGSHPQCVTLGGASGEYKRSVFVGGTQVVEASLAGYRLLCWAHERAYWTKVEALAIPAPFDGERHILTARNLPADHH